MTRTRLVAAIAAAAMALTLGACSDDDGGSKSASDAEKPYVEAATASLLAEEDQPFDESEAECIATVMVTTIGVERLEEAGVEPADLEDPSFELSGDAGLEPTAEDEEALANGLTDCIDVVDLFIEGMNQEADISEDLEKCLRDNIDEDQLSEAIAGGISGDEGDDDPSFFMDLLEACPELASA